MTVGSEHPRVPFPPPLPFLVALIAAIILNRLAALPTPWPTAARLVGIVVALAGFLLAVLAFRSMAREGTSPDARRPSTALVMRGPYRFTRNPIYLGFFLAYIGFSLAATTLWGIVLAPVLIIVQTRLVIGAEETYLADRFSGRYAEYAGRVRRWL